jgi:hypothetical protein
MLNWGSKQGVHLAGQQGGVSDQVNFKAPLVGQVNHVHYLGVSQWLPPGEGHGHGTGKGVQDPAEKLQGHVPEGVQPLKPPRFQKIALAAVKVAAGRNSTNQPQGVIGELRGGEAPGGMVAETQGIENLPWMMIVDQHGQFLEVIQIKHRMRQVKAPLVNRARKVDFGALIT